MGSNLALSAGTVLEFLDHPVAKVELSPTLVKYVTSGVSQNEPESFITKLINTKDKMQLTLLKSYGFSATSRVRFASNRNAWSYMPNDYIQIPENGLIYFEKDADINFSVETPVRYMEQSRTLQNKVYVFVGKLEIVTYAPDDGTKFFKGQLVKFEKATSGRHKVKTMLQYEAYNKNTPKEISVQFENQTRLYKKVTMIKTLNTFESNDQAINLELTFLHESLILIKKNSQTIDIDKNTMTIAQDTQRNIPSFTTVIFYPGASWTYLSTTVVSYYAPYQVYPGKVYKLPKDTSLAFSEYTPLHLRLPWQGSTAHSFMAHPNTNLTITA